MVFLMKILMIAPEPFFEPRGTPFSELFRIKALCALGHQVDLVTYPIGEDKVIPGLRIFRSWNPFSIKSVKTGPSFAKVFLDIFLMMSATMRLIRDRKKYHLIHTHEEGSVMGVLLNKITGIPHLYDMHSSLVQQMGNFQFTRLRVIVGLFRWAERMALRNADSIIVICRALFDYASGITEAKKLTLIENFIDDAPEHLDREKLGRIGSELDQEGKKIIMYTGTLEAYQGIPMLIDSLVFLDRDFFLVLIGGQPQQIEKFRNVATEKNLAGRVRFLGQKSPGDIPYYLRHAHVLVSPRTLGTNIPLKIYSYLKSGVPVVATDLFTHTQTLNRDIAILVAPDPRHLAEGIRSAVSAKGREIAERAGLFCETNYTFAKYLELVSRAVNRAVPNSNGQ